jgi:AmmeMemoRadiSam system protein B
VAGAFYPSKPKKIIEDIENCFLHSLGPMKLPRDVDKKGSREIKAVILPHAGYMYSGPAATHGYLELACEKNPDTVVILSPNHTGLGTSISIWGDGEWETPLGNITVNEEITNEIEEKLDIAQFDQSAHIREHSIEVHLPFLQYIYDDFQIVPITMGYQDPETCKRLSEVISDTIEDRDVLVLASTDLSHQESYMTAHKKDRLVITSITEMDEEKLYSNVLKNNITMCGYGPVLVTLSCTKKQGAKKAQLLKYYTSGDIIGDTYSVVGYASFKIM